MTLLTRLKLQKARSVYKIVAAINVYE